VQELNVDEALEAVVVVTPKLVSSVPSNWKVLLEAGQWQSGSCDLSTQLDVVLMQ